MIRSSGVAIQAKTLLQLPQTDDGCHARKEQNNREHLVRNVREEEVERRELGLDTEDTKEQEQSEVNKCNINNKLHHTYYVLCGFSKYYYTFHNIPLFAKS